MADYVKVVKLRDDANYAAFLLCGSSDGTGETGITKIDIDSLTNFSAKKTKVAKLRWSVIGYAVELLFDHTTAQTIAVLTGQGEISEEKDAPITDAGGAGGTGDIQLTTHGAQATYSAYTIYIEIVKVA
jgi:hypothetical protein